MAEGPDKLSIVVFSGDYDRVHYALVMASAAAAINKPVTLFFTMEAVGALLGPDESGQPGWRRLPGAQREEAFASANVATFETLLDACVELGVVFMVCDMGLRAMAIDLDDLRPEIPIRSGGVVTYLSDASPDGAMLFI